MKLPARLARLVADSTGAALEDAVARKRLADLLIDYRVLCHGVGPWQYAADLGAPVDATLRTIAYMAVWHDGPSLSIWADVQRLDAVDLLIGAAVEGFEDRVATDAEATA